MYTNSLQIEQNESVEPSEKGVESGIGLESGAKTKNMPQSKGMSLLIPIMIVGAITLAFVAIFYFDLFGESFKVIYVIKSAEADRHAINLAQVIMTYPSLVKNDSYVSVNGKPITRTHRTVLDREKLDLQMANEGYFDKYHTLTKVPSVADDVSYPDTVYVAVIEDLESGRIWALSGIGPVKTMDVEPETVSKKTAEMKALHTCLSTPTDQNILDSPGRFWGTFNAWASNCEAGASLKIKMVQKSFPIAIASGSSDSANAGRLTIRMTEW